MIPQIVVPMNGSRLYLTMHCCQVTFATERLVKDECSDTPFGYFRDYADYGCGMEVRDDLILRLSTHQLVGNNPLSLVSAAVVRDNHLTVNVMMTHTGFVGAAADLIIIVAGNQCEDLFSITVLARMLYQCIPQTA